METTKSNYQYEMEVFVSVLGYDYMVETVRVWENLYKVKVTRTDPEDLIPKRKFILTSTLKGLPFEECCEIIKHFRLVNE